MTRLIDLALALDQASATSRKLTKQQIMADFLRGLNPHDLRRAVSYASGKAFPTTDERVLGVSSAILTEVILDLLPVDRSSLRQRVIHQGEIGRSLIDLWPVNPNNSSHLTLTDLEQTFETLADRTRPSDKKPVLENLFRQCVQPLEACYLTKIILSDMRTGIKEGVLQAAVAQAFDYSLSDILQAQLLLGDLAEVAVLAREKRLHEARFRLFHPLEFMLASPIESSEQAPGSWIAENKLDGIRAQVHRSGERTAIFTRTLDRIDDSFPDILQQMRSVCDDVLIDGEIVPMQDGKILPFSVLQKRLGRKNITPTVIRTCPAVFVAFDLLYLKDRLLLDTPLTERKHLLETLAGRYQDLIVLPSSVVDHPEGIQKAFDQAIESGYEGLMLKNPTSLYTPGRRGGQWLKLKTHLPTLDCVVTAAEYGHGKRRGLLSDYTFAVWSNDQLVNIGKAYSGVTDTEIVQLTSTFKSLAVTDNGRVFRVRPEVVLEIAFDQILESTRHESGFALRFPRIKRIRYDKSASEADTLERVRVLYQSPANRGKKIPSSISDPEPSLFDGI